MMRSPIKDDLPEGAEVPLICEATRLTAV